MPQAVIKINALYGMSGASTAFRPHLVDLDNTKMFYYPERPDDVRYNIRWYCGTFSKRNKPRFLKRLPEGVDICKSCMRVARIRIGLPDEWGHLYPVPYRSPKPPVVHPLLVQELARFKADQRRRRQSKNAPF